MLSRVYPLMRRLDQPKSKTDFTALYVCIGIFVPLIIVGVVAFLIYRHRTQARNSTKLGASVEMANNSSQYDKTSLVSSGSNQNTYAATSQETYSPIGGPTSVNNNYDSTSTSLTENEMKKAHLENRSFDASEGENFGDLVLNYSELTIRNRIGAGVFIIAIYVTFMTVGCCYDALSYILYQGAFGEVVLGEYKGIDSSYVSHHNRS